MWSKNMAVVYSPQHYFRLGLANYGLWVKNRFYIFKWMKKIKRRIIFQDTWKFYEILIPMPRNRVLQKCGHSFIHITPSHYNDIAGAVRPRLPKIFTWPFGEEVGWPLLRGPRCSLWVDSVWCIGSLSEIQNPMTCLWPTDENLPFVGPWAEHVPIKSSTSNARERMRVPLRVHGALPLGSHLVEAGEDAGQGFVCLWRPQEVDSVLLTN